MNVPSYQQDNDVVILPQEEEDMITNKRSTQKKKELLVIPCAMKDHNHHTSSMHPSSPSWNTKKVVLGIIGLTAAVMSSATLFFSIIMDSSGQARTQSFLLQGYYPVTIKNDTPYDVPATPIKVSALTYVLYGSYIFCLDDFIVKGIASGDTWTASSRGLCLVGTVGAALTLPDGRYLKCYSYYSAGTTYSEFSIIMDGDDACCVRSSHQIQDCT